MTDLVDRLRAGICGDLCRVRDARSGCECAEAADEIERLRSIIIGAEIAVMKMLAQHGGC